MLKIQHKNFNKDRFQHKYKMFFSMYVARILESLILKYKV